MKPRLRARFGRLRGHDKVLAGLGVAIASGSVALATCSTFRVWVLTGSGRSVWLADGAVGGGWDLGTGFFPTGVYRGENGPPVWLPFCRRNAVLGRPGSVMVGVPLWIGAAVGCSLTVPSLVRMRRMRIGQFCSGCGYDLTGIDGVCPECGGSR